MHISFLPLRDDVALTVHKLGDVLTINGESFDFGPLPDGATIWDGNIKCPWIFGRVDRIDGVLHLTLRLPYRVGQRHIVAPAPLENPPDGALVLPDLDGGLEQREAENVDT